MRSMLLWFARMLVGWTVWMDVIALLSGGQVPGVAMMVASVLVLGVGALLSAPYMLAPPDTVTAWSMTLPMVAWLRPRAGQATAPVPGPAPTAPMPARGTGHPVRPAGRRRWPGSTVMAA